jgi:hypothetical protein
MFNQEGFEIVRDDKLCSTDSSRSAIDLEKLKSTVRDPRFVCSRCGRAASSSQYLCSPEKL